MSGSPPVQEEALPSSSVLLILSSADAGHHCSLVCWLEWSPESETSEQKPHSSVLDSQRSFPDQISGFRRRQEPGAPLCSSLLLHTLHVSQQLGCRLLSVSPQRRPSSESFPMFCSDTPSTRARVPETEPKRGFVSRCHQRARSSEQEQRGTASKPIGP